MKTIHWLAGYPKAPASNQCKIVVPLQLENFVISTHSFCVFVGEKAAISPERMGTTIGLCRLPPKVAGIF